MQFPTYYVTSRVKRLCSKMKYSDISLRKLIFIHLQYIFSSYQQAKCRSICMKPQIDSCRSDHCLLFLKEDKRRLFIGLLTVLSSVVHFNVPRHSALLQQTNNVTFSDSRRDLTFHSTFYPQELLNPITIRAVIKP